MEMGEELISLLTYGRVDLVVRSCAPFTGKPDKQDYPRER